MTTSQTVRDPRAHRAAQPRGRVLLLVEGTLDVAAALRLAEEARAQAAGAEVRIDLRHAKIHDAALAALARELDGRAGLVGLSQHHERILDYLAGAGAPARGAAP